MNLLLTDQCMQCEHGEWVLYVLYGPPMVSLHIEYHMRDIDARLLAEQVQIVRRQSPFFKTEPFSLTELISLKFQLRPTTEIFCIVMEVIQQPERVLHSELVSPSSLKRRSKRTNLIRNRFEPDNFPQSKVEFRLFNCRFDPI